MTVSITHATVATLPDEPGAEINKDQWNEDHQVLGLGTAAEADSTDFASAAQGALADSAVQPGDLAAIAASGSGADLIDGSIPFSKLVEMVAARLVGRGDSGDGVPQEIEPDATTGLAIEGVKLKNRFPLDFLVVQVFG